MKLRKCALLAASALMATAGLSQASLSGFTDYGYEDGTSASWDIFYGPNYQRNFVFETGTVGNPDTSDKAWLLAANVPGYVPGSFMTYATGPVGADGSTIPGDREQFYTFFADTVKFTIGGLVTGDLLNQVAFQALIPSGSGGGISNVLFNGLAADDSGINENDVNFWTWSGLNLVEGSRFAITFETTAQHSTMDAFQVQTDTQAVPEPSTYALMALGLGLVLYRFRKKLAQ